MKLAKLKKNRMTIGHRIVPITVPVPDAPAPAAPLRLDLGCGPRKKPGFCGVDQTAFPGVDVVLNLVARKRIITEMHPLTDRPIPGMVGDWVPWPWDDNTVEEAHASHVLEHFDAMERIHVLNELYRVLKPGAKCTLIVPHWCSSRAYGDPTHKWPPIGGFSFFYWKRDWRMANAPTTDAYPLGPDPHNNGGKTCEFNLNGFNCNFDVTWGFTLHPEVAQRNQEYQQYAMQFLIEATPDIIATLTKV